MSERAKPITPYQRLLTIARTFADAVRYAHRVSVWFYPKEKLNGQWNLSDTFYEVRAAARLGYDALLSAEDKGLCLTFRKRPEVPSELQ